MNFEAKIGEITDSVKSQVSQKKVFIGRVIEIEQIVMTGLNSFKFKKFSITEIKEKDIHQTLCKIIQNNEPSKRDLSIFNAYIQKLTVYSVDISYILENYHLLQYDNNCDKNKNILVKK
jgi:hypothetical protein